MSNRDRGRDSRGKSNSIRNNNRNNSRNYERNSSAGRRPAKGPKFIKARFVLGCICLLSAFVFVFRSCLAGLFKEGAGLGLWGLIPSVCFLVAGILTIQMLRSSAPLAFITPSVLCLLADITSLVHGGKAGEWKFWGILAAVIAIAFLVLLCLNKRKNLEAPYVFLGVTIILTILLLIFCRKPKDAADKDAEGENGQAISGEEEEQEDSEVPEEPVEVVPTEETLFLATDKFMIRYNRHEVGEDVNGEKCLYLYYDFTNNSSAALSIPSVSYTKLIQNETECGKASAPETNAEMNNYKTAVEPGMTVTACEVYAISDLSQVEFWAVEFIAAGGKEAAQILKLG